MSVMPSPEEPMRRPEGVHPDLAGLSGDVTEHTGDPIVDGFINMYLALPEFRMSNVLGARVIIDTGGGGRNLDLKVVGAHDSAIVTIDQSEPRSGRSHPDYLWVRGSVYVPDMGEEGIAQSDKQAAWANGISTIVGRAFRRTEEGLMMYVTTGTFCRDSMLAYSRAYSLNALRTRDAKMELARAPLHGSITLAYTGKHVEPLFVEQSIHFTDRIRNVYQEVDTSFVPLLQFTDEEDVQRNAGPT